MRIGELSSRTHVSTRSLRYYEEQNLLPTLRSPTGQRIYTEPSVERVHLIQELYTAGLSSHTILKLLPCVEAANSNDVTHSHEILAAEHERIADQIRALEHARDTLTSVIQAARLCASRAA